MTQVQTIFQSAELALAVHATLAAGATISNKQALIDAGVSKKQAEEFAKRYSEIVIPPYHDPISDLDVTVLRES